jgi:hypothetical protein
MWKEATVTYLRALSQQFLSALGLTTKGFQVIPSFIGDCLAPAQVYSLGKNDCFRMFVIHCVFSVPLSFICVYVMLSDIPWYSQ